MLDQFRERICAEIFPLSEENRIPVESLQSQSESWRVAVVLVGEEMFFCLP